MRIYNTLSGKKEKVSKKGEKRLFVCGPTVYDYSHIGHARTYLSFDIIVRYLRQRGWKIFYLQNITDIDDKIIKRAKKEGKSVPTIASFYENAYYEDIKKLGIESVDKYAKASNFIPEIIKQIKKLVKKGYAYQTKNGVYFEVKKFKNYGKLSKQNLSKLRPGWRIEPDPEKKDPLDFALWKISKLKGEPTWQSPWGRGRPGWHIEDTAISEKIFGPQYEWHGGAADLKFPHHEAEIAQQESASGKRPFVKIWMHTGLLYVDGKKMSKSLKNFITVRDFLKQHSPEVLRWIIFSHHYRSKINYQKEMVVQSKKSLETIQEFVNKLFLIKEAKKEKSKTKKQEVDVKKIAKEAEKTFHQAMEDDFNTPKAAAVIFRLVGLLQKEIWNLNKKEADIALDFIKNTLGSLGFEFKKSAIPQKIKILAERREKLRSNKQFIQADELRNKIKKLGYELEDTPFGPFIKRVK